MKRVLFILALSFFSVRAVHAQINLDDLRLKDLIGQVMKVEKGFAPK
ncbi:MAG: hypothetical protein H3C36_03995, partial [Chitinophagaceae bacterium]|nr:hypothetical protein [Chitinophagaceae bacterium]